MRKTFKYRIYANKDTLARTESWLEFCRNLYNCALEQRIVIYRQDKGQISCYDQIKQLPELKIEFPEYQSVGSEVLQEVLERLNRAYIKFFRMVKRGDKVGLPRFKSKNRYDSFTLKQTGWKLDGKYFIINKIGKYKLHLSRSVEGIIKTVTIHREYTGKWYICFSCDDVPEKRLPEDGSMVGLDVGVRTFLVDSEGNKIENPQYLMNSERLLRIRQRRLFRRVKGSRQRQNARLLIVKLYEKIRNQRNDFLHKLANKYIAKYGLIFIEDLHIQNMIKNKHLSKSISDSSWGKFFELLSYKAEEAGRLVVKVNPRNTSQICSGCGEKVAKTLADRIHACPYCGLIMDRDENAARNISRLGQSLQEVTYGDSQCVS